MLLISEKSEFHNLGAAIVNDLSPIVAADFFNGGVNNNYSIIRPKTVFGGSVLSDVHETSYKGRTIRKVMGGGGGGGFSACTNFFFRALLVREFFFQVKPPARIFFLDKYCFFSTVKS